MKREAKAIKAILEKSDDFHSIHTPFELCEEMLDKIPILNSEINILVMFNLEFVYTLREKLGRKGMGNMWFLTPCELKKKAAVAMGVSENKCMIWSYNTKEIIGENKEMRFDVVVGNPPYLKDLHLKMLKLAHSILADKGEIIWLHPARWLQDPLAFVKKGTNFIKYHELPFIDFKIISCTTAAEIFKNNIATDLVISHLKNNETSILSEDKIYELREIPITFKKLLKSKFTSINDVIESNKINGIRVRIKSIFHANHGEDIIKGSYNLFQEQNEIIIDGMINGKDWTDNFRKNQYSKTTGSPLPLSIKFNSTEEAQNFIDSTNTDVFLFFCFLTKLDVHVQLKHLPFMVNYKQHWTDERFKQYFDLSENEMIFIKNTMLKYKRI